MRKKLKLKKLYDAGMNKIFTVLSKNSALNLWKVKPGYLDDDVILTYENLICAIRKVKKEKKPKEKMTLFDIIGFANSNFSVYLSFPDLREASRSRYTDFLFVYTDGDLKIYFNIDDELIPAEIVPQFGLNNKLTEK